MQSFQEWLDETMEANCESEVFEVSPALADMSRVGEVSMMHVTPV
jgi:hypothetical protein